MSIEEKSAGKGLDWGDCPGVERNPDRLAGAWTFGNTRLRPSPGAPGKST